MSKLVIAQNSNLPMESVLAISMYSNFISIVHISPELEDLSHRVIKCTDSSTAANLHAKLQNQLADFNNLEQ